MSCAIPGQRQARRVALTVALLAASPVLAQQPASWTVVEELRIGDVGSEGPYAFETVSRVVPVSGNRFWLMASRAFEIRLFDSAGKFVRSVGRGGSGPGEFSANACAYPGFNGEVWVEDQAFGARRWQRFDAEGTLIGSLPVPSNIGCGIRAWLSDGRLMVLNVGNTDTPGSPTHFELFRLGEAGVLTHVGNTPDPSNRLSPPPGVRFRRGTMLIGAPTPFSSRAFREIGHSGDFWVSEGSDRYRIVHLSAAGDTLTVIDRPHTAIPIPDSMRTEAIRSWPPAGSTPTIPNYASLVPTTFPPFESMHVATDGRLWVRRSVAGGAQVFDVFSAEGIYMGEATLPKDFPNAVLTITSDRIYAAQRSITEAPKMVVRYRVQPRGR